MHGAEFGRKCLEELDKAARAIQEDRGHFARGQQLPALCVLPSPGCRDHASHEDLSLHKATIGTSATVTTQSKEQAQAGIAYGPCVRLIVDV